MSGRPLHTDSISHDGTWHYQLSGSKTWHLRPTQELLDIWSSDSSNAEGDDICDVQLPGKDEELTITCEEGDVILCNTRLWWHRTEISPTCGSISDNFSDGACTQNHMPLQYPMLGMCISTDHLHMRIMERAMAKWEVV